MAFMNLEVEFFQLNLLHLRPGCHYTPVSCHGMPKISHGGFAYNKIQYLDSVWLSYYFPVEMSQVIGITISVGSHMEKDEFTA